MLQRQYRLPHSVRLSHSSFFHTEYFSLRYQKNNLPYCRFGFVVSKKVDKRAVVRNRIKRVVRSCIEKDWLEGSKGYDVLFVLKKSCISAQTSNIWRSVGDIMTKLSV